MDMPTVIHKTLLKLSCTMLFLIMASPTSHGQEKFWHLQIIETPNYVIKGVMQDSVGLIWLGTNEGLFRYDGNNIKAYYPTETVSPHISKFNRVDRIQEYTTHDIVCQQRNILFLFDRKNETFVELPEELRWIKDVRDYKRPVPVHNDPWKEIIASLDCPEVDRIYMHHYDRDSNLWVGTSKGLWLITQRLSFFENVDQKAEVVSFFRDSYDRIWTVSTDGRLRIYDTGMNLLGYLSVDGNIVREDVQFPYPIRSIKQDRFGQILMAGRDCGVVLLRPKDQGNNFDIQLLKPDATDPHCPELENVYEIYIDRKGRLWVGGQYEQLNIAIPDSNGIYTFAKASTGLSRVQGDLPDYVQNFLELRDSGMIISSANGLYICNTDFKDFSSLRFRHYTQDDNDEASLPQNNIFGMTQSDNGTVVLSCGGQLCEIEGTDFFSETLRFRTVDTKLITPTVAALYNDTDGLVWGVTDRSIFSYDPETKNLCHYPPLYEKEMRHFSFNPFFKLNDTCLMKGCREGWIQFDPHKVFKKSHSAPIYISHIQPVKSRHSITVDMDTLITLNAEQREFTIHFSVLDYNRTSPIWYAYRIEGKERNWVYTSQSHTNPYVDLPAGTYTFAIRSTNGDGQWVDNEHHLHIKILPYWYEKTGIRWCMAILFLLLLVGIGWLIDRYIKKQTQKAMEKLRALQQEVSAPDTAPAAINHQLPEPAITDRNDTFSRKLLAYLDTHINDSELKVDDLALHLGMNRKLLVKKMKQLFNCTPIDFIIATRITRALQYMQKDKEMSISEIAYCSGFNDPRYFSRCFKKHTGKSPREYLNDLHKGK